MCFLKSSKFWKREQHESTLDTYIENTSYFCISLCPSHEIYNLTLVGTRQKSGTVVSFYTDILFRITLHINI